MSNFADSLLSLLLSWTRGFFSDIWSMLSGNSGSFIAWLSRYWLFLACLMIITGLLVDFIIYILRWRPHYVWRNHFHRFRGNQGLDKGFDTGYDDVIEDFCPDGAEVIARAVQDDIAVMNASDELARYYAQTPVQTGESITIQQLPGGANIPVERRRRSSRHQHRIMRTSKLNLRLSDAIDEPRFGAYPPPPVRVREAFHDPVYPSLDAPAWTQSPREDDSMNDDGFMP